MKAQQHGAERVCTRQLAREQETQGKIGCEGHAKEPSVWIAWDLISADLAVALLLSHMKLSSTRSASKVNLLGIRCRHVVLSVRSARTYCTVYSSFTLAVGKTDDT